jgi:hypothetical protein
MGNFFIAISLYYLMEFGFESMSAEGSGSKGLMNYKTLMILFFAVIINLVVCILVWRLDFFVHGDLYQYGLNYSVGWGDPYWNLTAMLWIFLLGATLFWGCLDCSSLLAQQKSNPLHHMGWIRFAYFRHNPRGSQHLLSISEKLDGLEYAE